jgi:hypothetical protein
VFCAGVLSSLSVYDTHPMASVVLHVQVYQKS